MQTMEKWQIEPNKKIRWDHSVAYNRLEYIYGSQEVINSVLVHLAKHQISDTYALDTQDAGESFWMCVQRRALTLAPSSSCSSCHSLE